MTRIIVLLIFIIIFPIKAEAVDISAKSACLITLDTGEVIYEKNSDLVLPMASTTKMMTALVAEKSGKWDEIATVSYESICQEGTRVYLEEGDKIKVSDLVCAMLLNSGNDAAWAVAEHISGDIPPFCSLMNEYAKDMGLKKTNFENPSGLNSENHYSTAYELSLIGREVIKNQRLSEIVKTKEMAVSLLNSRKIYLKNHNKLLWKMDGALGVKTGYTKKAGRCLVSAAERDGIILIAVTISAPNDWDDHEKLFDYGFGKCERKTIINKGDKVSDILVGNKRIDLLSEKDVYITNIKGEREVRNIEINRPKKILPPVKKGEKLGEAVVYQNGEEIVSVNLVASEDVETDDINDSFFSRILELFK